MGWLVNPFPQRATHTCGSSMRGSVAGTDDHLRVCPADCFWSRRRRRMAGSAPRVLPTGSPPRRLTGCCSAGANPADMWGGCQARRQYTFMSLNRPQVMIRLGTVGVLGERGDVECLGGGGGLTIAESKRGTFSPSSCAGFLELELETALLSRSGLRAATSYRLAWLRTYTKAARTVTAENVAATARVRRSASERFIAMASTSPDPDASCSANWNYNIGFRLADCFQQQQRMPCH